MSLPRMSLYDSNKMTDPAHFGADGWRTPDTYISRDFEVIPDAPGVYLLVVGGHRTENISYVGQAKSLIYRLQKTHDVYRLLRKEHGYVRRWFKLFPLDQLREIERRYIQLFDPPYNIIGRKRGRHIPEAA